MPIYEYICSNCGHNVDVIQKVSDPKLVDCPECSTKGLEKMVSAPSFRLKGTGWYETDFKNSNNNTQNTSETVKPSSQKSETTKSTK
jgi:putative FmdB family regulatory protein